MALSSFKPKARERRDRSDEFSSFVPRPRAPAAGSPELSRALDSIMSMPVEPRAPARKVQGRVRQDIRDSARGEECLLDFPGCPRDPERTIWSHNRHERAGKGGAMKALDLNGCYGCTHCDAIYDGQAPRPDGMTAEQVDLGWYRAHDKSLVKLAQKGLL